MGLDMYLTKKIYVGAEYKHRNVTGKIDIKVSGEPLEVNFSKVSEIVETVGYWRKANAIHKWMVDNIQDGEDDCREAPFPIEDIERLLEICNEIIEKFRLVDGKLYNSYSFENGKRTYHWVDGKIIENPEVANALLPTESGFFFGSINYDEYYYQEILNTKEILEDCLKDKNGYYYYHSSW